MRTVVLAVVFTSLLGFAAQWGMHSYLMEKYGIFAKPTEQMTLYEAMEEVVRVGELEETIRKQSHIGTAVGAIVGLVAAFGIEALLERRSSSRAPSDDTSRDA